MKDSGLVIKLMIRVSHDQINAQLLKFSKNLSESILDA
jgi:hypothetical protein